MAIEVQFKAFCDSAKHRGQGVEGRTVDPISLNGKGPRILELCDECAEELIAPLKELVAQVGRKPEDATTPAAKPKPDRQPLTCPLCGYSALNRGTMRDHAQNTHGTTLAAIETDLGKTLDGQPLKEKCSYCAVKFPNNRGRARHENSAHAEEVAGKATPIKTQATTKAKPRKAAAKKSA